MFVRRKPNKSGSTSVQVVDKSTGRYRVIQTIGSGKSEEEISKLESLGYQEISKRKGQLSLEFGYKEDQFYLEHIQQSLEQVEPIGPELVLGKLYDEIGFNQIPESLFRHLVICRLVHPGSKLKTVDYLWRYHRIEFSMTEVYRFLDKIYDQYQRQIEEISFAHTKKILAGVVQMVFYDVTTLYFEAESEDDLRKTGFSKDGKSQNPQIVLGLLVSQDGYPLAFQMFKGNTFEGHTMIPVIESFKLRFNLQDIVIVADAGLLSQKNLEQLKSNNYSFILGARIKNENPAIKENILSLKLKDGQSIELEREDKTRLIIGYSNARAKKDLSNRQRGLRKLETAIKRGKLTKANINNRGYNKYLKLIGKIKIEINQEKFNQDAQWDGLKGYVTNSTLRREDILDAYKHLWQIEKAFRISKTDLRIRPIYHRLQRRIQTHLSIAFCSYKLYKELERQLKASNCRLSTEKAIEELKTIFRITVKTPMAQKTHQFIWMKAEEQKHLLRCLGIEV